MWDSNTHNFKNNQLKKNNQVKKQTIKNTQLKKNKHLKNTCLFFSHNTLCLWVFFSASLSVHTEKLGRTKIWPPAAGKNVLLLLLLYPSPNQFDIQCLNQYWGFQANAILGTQRSLWVVEPLPRPIWHTMLKTVLIIYGKTL